MRTSSLVTIFLSLIAILLVAAGLYWLNSAKCERQWSRSGMKSEYALAQGCMVQRKDGTWIPASAYREVAQ